MKICFGKGISAALLLFGAFTLSAEQEISLGSEWSTLAEKPECTLRAKYEDGNYVFQVKTRSDASADAAAGERKRSWFFTLGDREFWVDPERAAGDAPKIRKDGDGALEITLPGAAEDGARTQRFHARFSTLFFVQADMVGREHSFRLPERGEFLLAPPVPESGGAWLRREGKFIVDSSGAPFRMVGMARCQYHDDQERRVCGPLEVQLAHYKKLGINTIRLAIAPNRDYDRKADYYKTGYKEFIDKYIDPEVRAIIDAGMYVVLDSHHIRETIEKARERIPLWEAIAERYCNEPRIAVYELWNESYLNPDGLTPASAPALREWFRECIAAIRKHDKRHLIMVSDWNAGWGFATGPMWSPEKFLLDEPYHQVIFSKHMAKDHCNPDYVAGALDAVADRWNVPLVIGELELEPSLQTAEDLKRLLDLLSDAPNQYGVWFWRPHADRTILADVWSPWARQYASPVPFPARESDWREEPAEAEAEEIREFPKALSSHGGEGAAFPADAPAYFFAALPLKRQLPPGRYEFELEYTAVSENAPMLGIYYPEGAKHVPLCTLKGKREEVGRSRFTRFISEPFDRMIVKKMEKNENSSTVLVSLKIVPLTVLKSK